ncbi:DUF3604 domain-containing protein [Verrucomicrobiota bacterium]
MSQEVPDTMPKWSRPIRIPKGIEITHVEPPFAIAGEKSTWRIPFKLSKDVPANSALKLQLWGGRNNKNSFAATQIEHPEAEGYIAAELEDGTRVTMQAGKIPGTYILALPDCGLKKGQSLTILLGGRTKGGAGIKITKEHAFNKFFVLYSTPVKETGQKLPQWAGTDVWTRQTEDQIVAVCTMHILGGTIHHVRAYAPATTRPGKTFHILVRPEDEFGNLSHQEMGDISISINGKTLEAEIEKVPDSTCLKIKASLSSEGIYRIKARETNSGCEAMTNPTICSNTAQPVYWGMIHGHTEMSDGTGKIDQYFHQLKDEVMLDFGASGDHDHLWETPDEFWKVTCNAVKRWHAPGEFVTLLGYEWAKWRQNGDGDRNVYYLDDDRPLYRSDDREYPSPPDLFNVLTKNKEKAMVIAHHTGHGGNFCDWKDHSPEHERLVEIFQIRGGYECSKEDGNPVPEKASKYLPYPNGYVQNALALGWRVGFTAGGDDHRGHWGTEFCFGEGYKQGLMSVEARENTRKAIFEAMYNRRVVATTGPRMLLTYSLNGKPLGSELSLKTSPGLTGSRKLVVEFHGTAAVDRIDIIRNNSVVHSASGTGEKDMCVTWEDRDPIDDIWLPAAKFCDHPFAFYYVRVVQQDGEVAWASPVWIDPIP